jgi:acetoin:2,6-dichlorophenolindophenol oxidoreductase subunit alpha
MILTKEIGLEMFRMMLRIRIFEEEAIRLFREGQMPGRTFPCTGEEAVSVGVSMHLNKGDFITSTHRPNGHLIAKGIDLGEMMAELFGRAGGSCRGKGGPMHIADPSIGILGANGIVGGGFPIACGAAFAAQYQKNGQVAVCYFGDGATNQGTFHEALNLAAIWNLPVVFVCENNKYGMSMKQEEHQTIEDIIERAPAYRIPAAIVDGNDVAAVFRAAEKAIEHARNGKGPFFLECKTYRKTGHSAEDPQAYRPQSDKERWQEMDPILRLAGELLHERIVVDSELVAVEEQVRSEVAQAVSYALNSPFPEPEETLLHVYCDEQGGERL